VEPLFFGAFFRKTSFRIFCIDKRQPKILFPLKISFGALSAANSNNLFPRTVASGGFAVFCEPPQPGATARQSEDCSIRAEDCEGLAVILRAFAGRGFGPHGTFEKSRKLSLCTFCIDKRYPKTLRQMPPATPEGLTLLRALFAGLQANRPLR